MPFRLDEAFRDSVVRMIRLNSSQAFAEMVARSGAIIATLGEPDFDGQGDIEGKGMSAQRQMIEHTVQHFRTLRNYMDRNASFNLEVALGGVLSLASGQVNPRSDWGLLPTKLYERLLAAVYECLGNAITEIGDRINCEDLRAGLLAAASMVDSMRTGEFDTDRHRDAASRVKMLVHRCRIAQHEDDIEDRRREREHGTVAALAPAEDNSIFG